MARTSPFVVQPELTAIAIAYGNKLSDFIADQVLPRTKPVGKLEFRYTVYDLSNFRLPNTLVGRKGVPEEANIASEERTAAISDYGLIDRIPQTDIDQGNKDGQNITGDAVEYLMGLIRLDRECRVARLVQNPTSYGNGLSTSLTAETSLLNPDVAVDTLIADALTKPMVTPNTPVMSRKVWSALSRHPQLCQSVLGKNGRGKITPAEFAEYFELNTPLIGKSSVSRAVKGKTPVLESVWGDHISLIYLDPTAQTTRGVTFGVSVPYGTAIAGSEAKSDIGLRGGVEVRVGESVSELILAPDAGYLIRNALGV